MALEWHVLEDDGDLVTVRILLTPATRRLPGGHGQSSLDGRSCRHSPLSRLNNASPQPWSLPTYLPRSRVSGTMRATGEFARTQTLSWLPSTTIRSRLPGEIAPAWLESVPCEKLAALRPISVPARDGVCGNTVLMNRSACFIARCHLSSEQERRLC